MSETTIVPALPPERLPAGTRLSDTYEIVAHIALGGMAEVYRAINVHTGEPVAIKLVLPEFARDETILAMFKKEATVLSRLRHDAIVHYHLFTVEPELKRPYLVMDFVDGLSLADKLAEGPLGSEAVRQMLLRVGYALETAHGFGVVHRDLSPDNIILPEGRVERAKVIDFGIAKAATIGDGTLLGGKFAGKYNFVSPEQLGLFGGDVTGQSDIYSLGLVAAAALLGAPLDMSGSHAEVVEKRRGVPDLGRVDAGLRPIVSRMLEPDPAKRPEGMSALVALLQAPPSQSARTVIRPALPTDPWASVGKERTEAPRAATTPPAAAQAERPLFDPLAPNGTVSESPFGAFEPAPAPASPRSTPASKSRRSPVLPLLALLLVGVAAGVGGWGYSQGWFGGAQQSDQEPATAPTEPVAPPTNSEPSPETLLPPTTPGPMDDATLLPPQLAAYVAAWINNYPSQSCRHIAASASSNEAVVVEAFGTNAAQFSELDREMAALNGAPPSIVFWQLNPEQCAVADFLRSAAPITEAGPTLTLASSNVSSAAPLTVEVQRPDGWTTQLFLVDDDGAIVDITSYLDRSGPDGRFELPMRSDSVMAVPAVILAVSQRGGTPFTGPEDANAEAYLSQLVAEMADAPGSVAATARYFELSP